MRCTGMTARLLALQNIRKYCHQHQRVPADWIWKF